MLSSILDFVTNVPLRFHPIPRAVLSQDEIHAYILVKMEYDSA